MLRNPVQKGVLFLLVMVLTAGICCAAETGAPETQGAETQSTETGTTEVQGAETRDADPQDAGTGSQNNDTAQEQLTELLMDLQKEYGLMSVGAGEFVAQNKMADIRFPEEIKKHEEGILFSELYDYDADGAPELLVLRRNKGYINFEPASGRITGVERSEYLFEMYEYYGPNEYHKSAYCLLSSRFVVGVADIYDIFSSHSSMTVFRRDADGRTELFMETFRSGQDHPEDISLLRFRYENGKFCDQSAIRYGALFYGDDNVRYLESRSNQALEILSYSASANETLWELKASSNAYDEGFMTALKEGLAKYGLTLTTTRYEAQRKAGQEQEAGGDTDGAVDVREYSALDCYGTEEGGLTPLASTYLHRGTNSGWEGTTTLKLGRFVYSEDPDGSDRPEL